MRAMCSACLVADLFLTAFAQAGPISVGETRVDNTYPEMIAFEVDVSSGAAISRVELHVSLRGDTSTTVIVATFEPGMVTTARAEWKTRRDGVPPGAPFTYQWEIWDEAGAMLTTPSEAGLTVDLRRTWSALIDDRVGVWWYEGDAAFGQRIFDLATTSLREMERESGLELPFRLHVVLYPDSGAFAEWHDYVQDWWAGEAYTTMGLTVQIVSPSDSWDWVQSVICHEVAHLFFYQATYNALSSGPATWMDEGYAQYHECVSNDWLGQMVEDAMNRGDLIPLRLATGSFSGDDQRIWLLYAESWSAVAFLYERWGDDGMTRLLEAFREGADSNDALRAATGLDFDEYQEAWWEWLGGMPGAYPTPPSPATGVAPLATPVVASSTSEQVTPTLAAVEESPAPASRAAWPCAGGAGAVLVSMVAIIPGTRAVRRGAVGHRWEHS
jgi:hypothetical protein